MASSSDEEWQESQELFDDYENMQTSKNEEFWSAGEDSHNTTGREVGTPNKNLGTDSDNDEEEDEQSGDESSIVVIGASPDVSIVEQSILEDVVDISINEADDQRRTNDDDDVNDNDGIALEDNAIVEEGNPSAGGGVGGTASFSSSESNDDLNNISVETEMVEEEVESSGTENLAGEINSLCISPNLKKNRSEEADDFVTDLPRKQSYPLVKTVGEKHDVQQMANNSREYTDITAHKQQVNWFTSTPNLQKATSSRRILGITAKPTFEEQFSVIQPPRRSLTTSSDEEHHSSSNTSDMQLIEDREEGSNDSIEKTELIHREPSPTDDFLDDILGTGPIADSSGKSKPKTFTFKKTESSFLTQAQSRKPIPNKPLVGCTSAECFDVDDESSGDLDANFEFGGEEKENQDADSLTKQTERIETVDSDSDIVFQPTSSKDNHHRIESVDSYSDEDDVHIAFQAASKQRRKPKRNVILDDSQDDIEILTEKINKIPLGQKKQQPPPKRTIFLESPPSPPPAALGSRKGFDPMLKGADTDEYLGDVRRTVSKLAEAIEEMPTPDDYEPVDKSLFPKKMVQLFEYQEYGLKWLRWRECEFPGGGILADEMGLGKTIMMIALIATSKLETCTIAKNENWIDSRKVSNLVPSQTTLVVCPVACLLQWQEEIRSKSGGCLSVLLYHGVDRTKSAAKLAQYDVVLSTYGTVAAEFPKSKSSNSPFGRLYWKRIVLDEAHQIRNPKTVGAMAVSQLTAKHRWAVTGTPVHNRPEDFFSMLKFLHMVPFDEPKVFDFWIGLKKLKAAEETRRRLEIISKAIILRRTKAEVFAGKKLPPKTVEIVPVELKEEERRLYDYLEEFCRGKFKDFMLNKEQREKEMQAAANVYTATAKKRQIGGGGEADVRFSHLFVMLMRLRQCSVLPSLIKGMLDDDDEGDDSFDELNEADIISAKNPIFASGYQSSKIEAILKDLLKLREEAKKNNAEMDKVVIISSWTSLLDQFHIHLRKNHFRCVFIDGRQDAEEKKEAMKAFNNEDSRVKICLVSLNAGGVGINLIGGNHVFFMEPHWNPQLERQAQDRVHRIGQKKDVTIRRYISSNTIESRVCDLQDQKLDIADGVLNSANSKSRGTGLSVQQMKLLFDM